MQQLDLTTLACVHPACQRFRLTGQDSLTVRKVYGQDRLRRLRCCTCGAECSARRDTSLFNTKIAHKHSRSRFSTLRLSSGEKNDIPTNINFELRDVRLAAGTWVGTPK